GQILVGASGSFCSESARTEVEGFYSTHKVNATSLSLKHAIEEINGCIELRRLQETNLKTWLQEQPGLEMKTRSAE
ncbi:MAG: hypothetical protein ACRD25_09940, partial [Terracidiphilus sp.]